MTYLCGISFAKKNSGVWIDLIKQKQPQPSLITDYLDVTLQLQRQHIRILSIKRGAFKKPTELPRFTGTHKLKLIGQSAILHTTNFNFPLTAAAGEPDAINTQLNRALQSSVTATAILRIPWLPQATHIQVIDGIKGATYQQSITKTYNTSDNTKNGRPIDTNNFGKRIRAVAPK